MRGWHKESYRHYLAAKGIKTNRYYRKIPKRMLGGALVDVKARKADSFESVPFKYQDENQERMIHSDWGGGALGATYANRLMDSGDIFRELAQPTPHKSYIGEKVRNIERHILKQKKGLMNREEDSDDDEFVVEMKKKYNMDPRDTGIHPADSRELLHEANEDKISALYSAWDSQPYETDLQKEAVELNKAMIVGDYDEAQKQLNLIKGKVDLKEENYKYDWEIEADEVDKRRLKKAGYMFDKELLK